MRARHTQIDVRHLTHVVPRVAFALDESGTYSSCRVTLRSVPSAPTTI